MMMRDFLVELNQKKQHLNEMPDLEKTHVSLPIFYFH